MRKNGPYKGRFSPTNPAKYKGDPTGIIFRSLWERKLMTWLDRNPAVLEWASEEIAIPYISPVDGKKHRYFPDFHVKVRTKDGGIKEMILEVKPSFQTREPRKKSRVTKQYLIEVATWGVNQAKWKAAADFCADRGWSFKLITEVDLGITNGQKSSDLRDK